jgi:uncharacterized membrane protein (UPF0127 family)
MVAWTLIACSLSGTPGLSEGMIGLDIGGQVFRVEVADEPGERQSGLMYRTEMSSDAGMIFVYPDEKKRSFWMENTRIPLSIAYIDRAGTIVHIADMVPFDRSPVSSVLPAMYALELNRGQFKLLGIEKGAQVAGLPGPSEE